MIDCSAACRIALENAKQKNIPYDYKISSLRDCEDFYSVGFAYYDQKTGSKVKFTHPILEVDVSKQDGSILPFRFYFLGNEYGKAIDEGKIIEIPEEFK